MHVLEKQPLRVPRGLLFSIIVVFIVLLAIDVKAGWPNVTAYLEMTKNFKVLLPDTNAAKELKESLVLAGVKIVRDLLMIFFCAVFFSRKKKPVAAQTQSP